MSENPPSIIHIDVEIYSSTLTVLKWLDKIALPMSIYIFDDNSRKSSRYWGQKAIQEYNL